MCQERIDTCGTPARVTGRQFRLSNQGRPGRTPYASSQGLVVVEHRHAGVSSPVRGVMSARGAELWHRRNLKSTNI